MSQTTKLVSSLLDADPAEPRAEASRVAWNASLRGDPEALADYCRQLRIHALLKWKFGCISSSEREGLKVSRLRPSPLRRWRWLGMAAAAVVVATSLILLAPRPADAAMAALNRMISVAAGGGDRSYRLAVLDGEKTQRLLDQRTVAFEGALLHLGRGGRFVIQCDLSDGTRRISGSDGATSWDIMGSGPVHLSNDPTRFRHHLPGERENFTFLDPGSQLSLLREGYDISFASESASGQKTLRAVKRSKEIRGPREARISFDAKTSIILSIELMGLPLARGGPSALRLTLISESTFPEGFFRHTHHHESGRSVEMEPNNESQPH